MVAEPYVGQRRSLRIRDDSPGSETGKCWQLFFDECWRFWNKLFTKILRNKQHVGNFDDIWHLERWVEILFFKRLLCSFIHYLCIYISLSFHFFWIHLFSSTRNFYGFALHRIKGPLSPKNRKTFFLSLDSFLALCPLVPIYVVHLMPTEPKQMEKGIVARNEKD